MEEEERYIVAETIAVAMAVDVLPPVDEHGIY